MPANVVKTSRDEHLWEKAKTQARKKKPAPRDFYAYVMGIYEQMKGEKAMPIILIKAHVKPHQRRTATGKVVSVRGHQAARKEGVQKPPKRKRTGALKIDDPERKRMMTVAQTIKQQIGGQAAYMLGAKNWGAGKDNDGNYYLQFKIGRNDKGVNVVKITLNAAMDTYDIEYWRLHGAKFTMKSGETDIYADQLNESIERNTGMYTSMGTMGVKKAVVRAHQRRAGSGKITIVREHQTRRAKGPPQDPSKLTRKQQRVMVDKLAKLPLKELRRRQDINASQQKSAYAQWKKASGAEKERLERGSGNLQIMERMLTAAVNKQSFGKAMVRAHQRRTKTGKITTVREHQKQTTPILRALRTKLERALTRYEKAGREFRWAMQGPMPILEEGRKKEKEDQARTSKELHEAHTAMVTAKDEYEKAGGRIKPHKSEKAMDMHQFPALQKAIDRVTLSKSLEFNKKGSEIKANIEKKIVECRAELAVMVIEWKAGMKVHSSDGGCDEAEAPTTAVSTDPPEEPWKIRNKRREIEDMTRVARNIVESKTYKISEYELREYGF